jgi:hypothetical protein
MPFNFSTIFFTFYLFINNNLHSNVINNFLLLSFEENKAKIMTTTRWLITTFAVRFPQPLIAPLSQFIITK